MKVIDKRALFCNMHISMGGEIDLSQYCPSCENNEFVSNIGTDCAHCGTEITERNSRKTKWVGLTNKEVSFLYAKYSHLNTLFSFYMTNCTERYKRQETILDEFDQREGAEVLA